jgi:FeS assembly protein IscX
MTWEDVEDVADALQEAHPDTEVLSLKFTTLRKWILALEGFEGDANDSSEKALEEIQMAWHDIVG